MNSLESEKVERREYVDEKLRQLEGYEVKLNIMEEKVEKAEQDNEALIHVSQGLAGAFPGRNAPDPGATAAQIFLSK